jgi:amino acid transporter
MIIKLRNIFFGSPKDPFDKNTRHHISLIAFFAWVGLGADGISSSSYGPEEAFLALGSHQSLGIYLAIATAFTVFIISYAYMQVIELFPNGGGGYRVATKLLGKHAGLISGSALIIDYVLTISISIASGIDALFSFLPNDWQKYKIFFATFFVCLLAVLNLRGMKESIKFLLPIFLGFMITHVTLIIYGIATHHYGLPNLIPQAAQETSEMQKSLGWLFVLSVFLKAFSMGGGTYTGLEAVSNNVNTLSEPRIRTAKITMFLVAISLAFMAAGIILIYLLWDIQKIEGQTLNATAFYAITSDWFYNDINLGYYFVPLVLIFSAGLLFVAANAGFLAGPNVISNMAHDEWLPKSFTSLSSRLVVKNGILFMAVAAILTLIITGGEVHMLVVLYSINVFITFSMSLLGLMIYWVRHRRRRQKWLRKLITSAIGFVVCFSILIVTIFEKFYEGGWVTILITSVFIVLGLKIKKRYQVFKKHIQEREQKFYKDYELTEQPITTRIKPDKSAPTAAIIVDQAFGGGMNSIIEIEKLFPNIFKNFIFVTVGELDSNTFMEEKRWRDMRRKTKNMLRKYKNYYTRNNLFNKAYVGYSTDIVEKLSELAERIHKEYERVVFFDTKFIFDDENILNQILFNHVPYTMQRKMHIKGMDMIVLPMKINSN